MPFSLKVISGYEPVATGPDKCIACRYYKGGFCRMLIDRVNAGGWCRFFREKF